MLDEIATTQNNCATKKNSLKVKFIKTLVTILCDKSRIIALRGG